KAEVRKSIGGIEPGLVVKLAVLACARDPVKITRKKSLAHRWTRQHAALPQEVGELLDLSRRQPRLRPLPAPWRKDIVGADREHVGATLSSRDQIGATPAIGDDLIGAKLLLVAPVVDQPVAILGGLRAGGSNVRAIEVAEPGNLADDGIVDIATVTA